MIILLSYSSSGTNPYIVQHLALDLKVDANKEREGLDSTLFYALQPGHEEVAVFLLDQGNANVTTNHLKLALDHDMAAVITHRLVLEQIDTIDPTHHGVICQAVCCGAIKVMRSCIQHFGTDLVNQNLHVHDILSFLRTPDRTIHPQLTPWFNKHAS